MRGRPLVLLTLISRLALALPSEAFAHRVYGEAETIPEVIRLGIRHTRYSPTSTAAGSAAPTG
jgi:hypothetical protein